MASTSVALFVGSDITSQVLGLRLSKLLTQRGSPVMFVEPFENTNMKPCSKELQTIRFLERQVLHNLVYPRLSGEGENEEFLLSPALYTFSNHLFSHVRTPDVNSLEFLRLLLDHEVSLGVSIRSYQKFKGPIINYFSLIDGQARLYNLHPGLLPEYRGVMTFIRALSDDAPKVGYTLHKIDFSWDSGPVVGKVTIPVTAGQTALWHMYMCLEPSLGLVVNALEGLFEDEAPPCFVQDESKARYFSFPTEGDFEGFEKKKISYVVDDDIVMIVRKWFLPEFRLDPVLSSTKRGECLLVGNS